MGQVDLKLEEVRAGRALEYLNPLSQLQENMRMRTEVAGKTLNMYDGLCSNAAFILENFT